MHGMPKSFHVANIQHVLRIQSLIAEFFGPW
jgi:hypothetical protein